MNEERCIAVHCVAGLGRYIRFFPFITTRFHFQCTNYGSAGTHGGRLQVRGLRGDDPKVRLTFSNHSSIVINELQATPWRLQPEATGVSRELQVRHGAKEVSGQDEERQGLHDHVKRFLCVLFSTTTHDEKRILSNSLIFYSLRHTHINTSGALCCTNTLFNSILFDQRLFSIILLLRGSVLSHDRPLTLLRSKVLRITQTALLHSPLRADSHTPLLSNRCSPSITDICSHARHTTTTICRLVIVVYSNDIGLLYLG